MTLFGLLLRFFPAAFRAAFSEEMRQVFVAQREDARAAGLAATVRFWIRTVKGMACDRDSPSSRICAMAA